MKVFRFIDSEGKTRHGTELPSGDRRVLDGDISAAPVVTNRPVVAKQMLAPIAPLEIIGIGTDVSTSPTSPWRPYFHILQPDPFCRKVMAVT